MAKIEKKVTGDFDEILEKLDKAIFKKSKSASYEDGSDYRNGDFRCSVRVYERYSFFGQNRVSMSITLAGREGEYLLSIIASGGSQALFSENKINFMGEQNFLDTLSGVVDEL